MCGKVLRLETSALATLPALSSARLQAYRPADPARHSREQSSQIWDLISSGMSVKPLPTLYLTHGGPPQAVHFILTFLSSFYSSDCVNFQAAHCPCLDTNLTLLWSAGFVNSPHN